MKVMHSIHFIFLCTAAILRSLGPTACRPGDDGALRLPPVFLDYLPNLPNQE